MFFCDYKESANSYELRFREHVSLLFKKSYNTLRILICFVVFYVGQFIELFVIPLFCAIAILQMLFMVNALMLPHLLSHKEYKILVQD